MKSHQQVKELISANRTDQALELLAKKQLSSLDKELIILNSRYNQVKEDQILGVINAEEARKEINKINLAILHLSEKISLKSNAKIHQAVFAGNQARGKLFEPKVLIPALILIVAVAVAGFFMFRSEPTTEMNQQTAQTENEIIPANTISNKDITEQTPANKSESGNDLTDKPTEDKPLEKITSPEQDTKKEVEETESRPVKHTETNYVEENDAALSDSEYEAMLERAYLFLSEDNYQQAEAAFRKIETAGLSTKEMENGLKLIQARKNLIEGFKSDPPESFQPGRTYSKCILSDYYETVVLENGKTERRLVKKGGWTDWKEVICSNNYTILDSEQINQLQLALNEKGLFYGPFDSKMNNNLKVSIRLYEAENKLGSNCLSANPTDCIFYPNIIINKKVLTNFKIVDKFLKSIQKALNDQGYEVKIDGSYDEEDKKIITQYQKDNNFPIGKYSQGFLEKLGISDEFKKAAELMPEPEVKKKKEVKTASSE